MIASGRNDEMGEGDEIFLLREARRCPALKRPPWGDQIRKETLFSRTESAT